MIATLRRLRENANYHASAQPRWSVRLLSARTGAWLTLCIVQMLVTSWLFELTGVPRWQSPVFYLREFVLWLVLSAVAFAGLAWTQRHELLAAWRAEQVNHHWLSALGVNLGLFAVLTLATVAFTAHAAAAATPPWGLFGAYALVLGACALSLARLDVSLRSLWTLFTRFRSSIVASAGAGLAVLLVSTLAIAGWNQLAGATLQLTKRLLDLYETDVSIDAAQHVLGIGDFSVHIDQSCSGYEGIGLVTAFLALYLWAFRSTLRFPHAFLLMPLGVGAIWILNSVRIAALVSIGAHVSPEVAVQGFHSQAGWMAFLAVTVGIMVLAQRSSFLSTVPQHPGAPAAAVDRAIVAYLAPFVVLMLASILMAASAPHGRPLYALKVVGVGAALWMFRDVYRTWSWRISPASILIGLVVAAGWIATAPATSADNELRLWLEAQSVPAAVLWLTLRVLGATITVAIAEELAFRGFLHRWLISRRFEAVPIGQISLMALCVSSLLFGGMHDRWIAASLSGAIFAIAMYRTGRISDPIAAHMTANAAICAWAIANEQWALL